MVAMVEAVSSIASFAQKLWQPQVPKTVPEEQQTVAIMAASIASFVQKLWQQAAKTAEQEEAVVARVNLGAAKMKEIDPYSTAVDAETFSSLGHGGFGHVFKVRLVECGSSSTDPLRTQKKNSHGAVALKIFKSVDRPSSEKDIKNEMEMSMWLSRLASEETPIARSMHTYTMKEAHLSHLQGLTSTQDATAVVNKKKRKREQLAQEEELHCMSIELCEGGDLMGVLKEMKRNREGKGEGRVMMMMTEKEAATFLYPVARAIRFCHKNRVLHLDVKPQNILLKKKGRLETACLTDFSLATRIPYGNPTDGIASLSDAFRNRAGTGTEHFMAPEVALSGYYSPLADVFSLGCVLLYALTGCCFSWKRCWSWQNMDVSYVDDIMSDQEPRYSQRWAQLSPNARNIICGMLCPNPLRRLSLNHVLAHPWLADSRRAFHDQQQQAWGSILKEAVDGSCRRIRRWKERG